MSNNQFKVGDQVSIGLKCGTITSLQRSYATVKLEEPYNDEYHFDISELSIYDEQQYKELRALVQGKIQRAADTLEVAFALWNEVIEIGGRDLYSLEEVVDIDPYVVVIEKNGWSSSSLYC
jgi:hypothetical protein